MQIGNLMIYRMDREGSVYRPARGSCTTFMAVMRGELTLTSGADLVRLPACSMLFMPSALVGSVSPGEGVAGICWDISGNATPSPATLRPQPMDEFAAMLLQDAAFEQQRDPEVLDAALLYLSRRALSGSMPEALPAEPESEAPATRICRHMAANLDSPLTLHDLAVQFDCTPSALLRTFRKAGHPSPMRYLAELRIRSAKESLRQSEASISNIAAGLGYRDLAAFSHFFRTHTGLSPRAYRENCRWLL
jgi:AraC-like DNA-binding protein